MGNNKWPEEKHQLACYFTSVFGRRLILWNEKLCKQTELDIEELLPRHNVVCNPANPSPAGKRKHHFYSK